MIANQQILLFIIKREPISLIFKDIFCFQKSSRAFSSFLQIFNSPATISLSKGNQSPKLHKTSFLGD